MTTRPHRSRQQAFLPRLTAIAAAAQLLLWLPVQAQTPPASAVRAPLPVACSVTASCTSYPNAQGVTRPITQFLNGSDPRIPTGPSVNGNTMTVNQTSSTALFNWRSFDIARDNTVNFSQPGRNAVAINRIYDTQTSRIDGKLSANGQVYLINPNGLLFGSGANVDVAGLIASTLDINPSRVESGLLGRPSIEAAFSVVNSASAGSAGVDIQSGARIHAGVTQTVDNKTITQAGSVFIFAPRVSNEGAITVTPGGQVVMAAGERIYLAGSDSATLRGLLVEVGQGGVVSNRGEISTPRGNTTMVGMAVNQVNRVNATSAINENGSIRLLAREVAGASGEVVPIEGRPQTGSFLKVTNTGQVNIESGAQMTVTLDPNDKGTAALNDTNAAQARSTILVEGRQINIGGNGPAGQTLLQAHGGDVIVQARTSLDVINKQSDATEQTILGRDSPAATLTIGSDVKIDVSGVRDALVDGARNYVFIDRLTSNDMRDAPLQRDSFLRGQGVHINVARDHSFIDVSNRRAAVAGNQAERNATGGTISLRAEGRVDVAQGANFDISGGTTRTTAANGRTSQLITENGRVVDIANARADERYVGFADRYTATVDAPREGASGARTFDAPVVTALPEFVEGKAAGTLEINAPRGSFAGAIQGQTSPGAQQRANLPAGGELRLGSITGSRTPFDLQINYLRPHVLVTNTPADAAFQVPGSQADRLLVIDSNTLRSGGVSRLDVRSDGVVTVAPGTSVDAGPSGSIALRGANVDVGGDLNARGGSIDVVQYVRTLFADDQRLVPDTEAGRIRFGRGVRLDASGLYTNDQGAVDPSTALTSPILRNGGRITVAGRDVDVADVASINVDAGASVSASGAVSGGRAGQLSVVSSPLVLGTIDEPSTGRLNLGDGFAERVRGFGFTAGGNLTLAAPRASLGAGGDASATSFDLGLLDRGFETFTFRGADFLDVTPGTALAPTPRLYGFRRDQPLPASGASLAQALTPQTPLPGSQRPTSITLSATRAGSTVRIGEQALVDGGAAGAVQVQAGQSIVSQGELRARGGSVSLSLASVPLANENATTARFEQRAIQLTDGARIDVSGVSQVQTGADGRRSGAVLDGGQVTINAELGSFAQDAGARITADGTRDAVDLRQGNNLVRTDIASRGGAVSIRAQNGLFIEGDISGRAGGSAVEGGRLSVRLEGLRNVQRNLDGAQNISEELFNSTYRDDRVLSITEQATLLPAAGQPFSAPSYAGRGQVRPGLVNDSGFDAVQLGSTNTIAVQTDTTLRTATSLTLDTQALRAGPGAAISLEAPRLSLGFQARGGVYQPNLDADASGGSGSLTARAEHVDLVGGLALQGIGQTTLSAQGDVRLRGQDSGALRSSGQLRSEGSLAITAAQLTPASMTDYTIDLGGSTQSRLSIESNGQTPLEPLSAAGSITLRANQIDIAGRVSAPHGRIAIDAREQARVQAGAVLSVAGTQAVPLGTVFNGNQWVYANDPNLTQNNLASGSGANWPDKGISVEAPVVDIDPQARLDVSGGGSIVTQEFVRGPGGSVDWRLSLFPPATSDAPPLRNPYFALIPARSDAPAPVDTLIMSGLTSDAAVGGATLLRPGQTITLGAGSGIPAGTYTVMPPAYALLPGAYALQPAGGYADLQPGASVREATGAVVVAGRLGVGEQASTQRWSGYRVLTGQQFRRLAEWQDSTATTLLTAAARAADQPLPRTPLDAGTLQVSAGQLLRFSTASIAATPGQSGSGSQTVTGRGAALALAAPELVVSDQTAPSAAAPSDMLQLQANSLTALNAERLVLGATAQTAADGTITIQQRSRNVSVGGTQTLQAGEVLLAASDRVSVAPGARIVAPESAQAATTRVNSSDGGAALLVSSAADLPVWARSGNQGQRGDLSVAQSAALAGRSLVFDASREQTFAPSTRFEARNVGLSSSSVNLGDVPQDAPGLALSNGLLAQLSQVEQLNLSSGSTFNVYGNAMLGDARLRRLSLDGAGLLGATADANLSLRAGDVILRNSAGTLQAALPPSNGTGTLTINAQASESGPTVSQGRIEIGAGAQRWAGFAQTTLIASSATAAGSAVRDDSGHIRFTGTGSVQADGNVTLDAARINAGRGADQGLTASGVLRTAASTPDSADTSLELGARLNLNAQRIDHGGRIVLSSGEVRLNATGAAAGDDVLLLGGSQLSVAGSTQRFADQTADASAGAVSLTSANGSVRTQAGSVLDLSGAGERGDAGRLQISAINGGLALDGRIATQPGSDARGVSVSVDVSRLPNLGVLAPALTDASAANPTQAHSLHVRVRRGDVQLAADQTLSAHDMRIAVDGGDAARANDGSLRIEGTLNASGERAGRVELHARQQIALGDTARINAVSSGTNEEGGSVLLSARIRQPVAGAQLDAITIANQAQVDVRGGTGASGGTMTLRAPWQLAPQVPNLVNPTNDVAIAGLPGNYLRGARSEVVEATYVPVLTTAQQTSLTLNATGAASATNPLPTWRTQLQNFMTQTNIDAISGRLGRSGSVTFDLRPGLEVQTPGNINVASLIDFTAGLSDAQTGAGTFTWRYGGNTLATSQPGALTLRAGGNLTLTGGLTDGFRTLTNTGGTNSTAFNTNAQLTPFDAGVDTWRYQLTGGADLSGAAAAAVQTAGGAAPGKLELLSATLVAPTLIRTGTGRIDLAAAGDIQLGVKNGIGPVAVYTGGQRATDAPPAFANTVVRGFNPNFTTGGGGIRAEAGLDIFFASSPTQLVNNWLWRAGRATETTDNNGVAGLDFSGNANAPTSWWVNAGTFTQGIGALGGGDLSISAGRDVRSVTAAVPTNANLLVENNTLRERNGGDLDVQAGRNILGGLFYAQRGDLNLRADSIAPLSSSSSDVVFVAQGDNLARLQARGDVTLVGAFNPTLAPTIGLFGAPGLAAGSPMNTVFSTYGAESELDVRSWAGSIAIQGDGNNVNRAPIGQTSTSTNLIGGPNDRKPVEALPGTTRLVSFGNDVSVQRERLLWPSANGQLQVLASDAVVGGSSSNNGFVMGAINPDELPDAYRPQQSGVWRTGTVPSLLGGRLVSSVLVVSESWGLNRPQNHGESSSPLHAGDRTAAAVVARSGNIENINIQVPKSLDLQAAGDVLNVSVSAQNVSDGDVTRVHAGGRIGLSNIVDGITITGPGLAEVLAGKDIDLGRSDVGIVSRGNLVNSQQLPAEGANLVVASGLGTTGQGFVQRPAYDNVLRQFVRFDAFVASGRDAATLNSSTLDALGLSAQDRAALNQALRDRGQALQAGSAFETWLNGLSEPKKAALSLKLIEQVQATANQRFVSTRNSETFAPGYTLLGDLFPTLASSAEGVRQFVQNNPFKGADNADQLRRDVLQDLPQPLREAIELGLAAPAGGSAEFDRALAALPRDTLDAGARQLNADVQRVAGTELDALRAANRLEPNVATPFARGLDAQARAFAPRGLVGANGINLVFSQIKTEQSGDMALLAPRGGVLVGLANPPAGGSSDKKEFELGMLSLGGGDISAFVRDTVNVFGSRVFTVAGGDVHLWAGVGNIDAGKGPRDVAVAPPPRLVIDGNTGIVSLDITASVTGSGIGALVTREDQPTSNIRLIAPNGFIDAGEAGIRADRGTVTLGTNVVLNSGNISAPGGVTGGAVVVAPSAPLPKSTDAAPADKVVEQAKKALEDQTREAEERAKKERRKRVIGEFLGFGEGP